MCQFPALRPESEAYQGLLLFRGKIIKIYVYKQAILNN